MQSFSAFARRRAYLLRVARGLAPLALIVALTTSHAALARADAAPSPRDLSPAEIAAIELVAAYFDAGIGTLWPHLAADAPLRALGERAALEELKTRLGASRGARWTLETPGTRHDASTVVWSVEYATGIQDTLLFVMAGDTGASVPSTDVGGWRLQRVISTVEPRDADDLGARLFVSAASGTPSFSDTIRRAGFVAALGLGLLLCLVRPRRGLRAALLGAAAASLLLACGDTLRPSSDKTQGASASATSHELVQLRQLLPLRRALTDPAFERPFEAVRAAMPGDGLLGDAVRAWTAQHLQQAGRLADAETILAALPDPSPTPLVSSLRARQALLRGRLALLDSRYERALAHRPDTDGFRLEAITAQLIAGDERGAEISLELLLDTGTRRAESWYLASRFAAAAERREDAASLFRVGWTLEPLRRAELFAEPLLAWAGTQPENFDLFEFGSASEPARPPSRSGEHALELPDPALVRSRGDLLEVEIDGSVLVLPGAAPLAPGGTAIESAADAARRRTDDALARLDELARHAGDGGLRHPARRRLAETAARALLDADRWTDVLHLTDGLVDGADQPTLLKARARSLFELGRDAEAKNLLVRVAKNDFSQRRRDPGTLYELAEMFVETAEYDLALELLEKADALSPWPVAPQRIRQIEMDRDLETRFETLTTDHFVLRYPTATGPTYPRQLAWVLEAEWQRLQQWIPVPPGADPVEVHLFPLDDFMEAYSAGVTVLGIFDGRVRVPLADLKSLHPLLVSIVSHEIAHAMIDLATDGKAPKWLHEGLASHVEMSQNEVNPIPDLHAVDRDLSFTVIEPILRGFAEPEMVDLAYRHATWALHYVEATRGVRGIHDLLRAVRDGADTQQAIERALGVDVATFDRAMHHWALTEAPALWPTELVRYDESFDPYVQRDRDRLDLAPPARDLPRVATRQRAHEVPPDRTAERLRAWHTAYSRDTAPAKRQLALALPMLRGQAQGDLQAACRNLADAIIPLFDSPSLEPPERPLRVALMNAYTSFHRAARHCMRGETAQVHAELERAQSQLGAAHGLLAPHGLAP